MSEKFNATIAVVGIDIGKNLFHAVGLDERVPSCCGRSCPVGRWKHGLPTYRRA
jgi:hypothetical protein